MASLLSFLRGNRRAHARLAQERSVAIFSGASRMGVVRLTDESRSGAQLRGAALSIIPTQAMLLDSEAGLGRRIRIVWRSGNVAGVRYLKTQDLRGFVPQEFDVLKDAWRRAASSSAA